MLSSQNVSNAEHVTKIILPYHHAANRSWWK